MADISRKTDQYPLRLPEGMRDRIRQQAAVNRRSVNSEIIFYLDQALEAREENGPAAGATALDQEPTTP